MTFDEWLVSIPDDEKHSLCLCDSWRAGALAMFKVLTRIDCEYVLFEEEIRREVHAILGEEP